MRQLTASKCEGESNGSHRDDGIEERELAGCVFAETWLCPHSNDVH